MDSYLPMKPYAVHWETPRSPLKGSFEGDMDTDIDMGRYLAAQVTYYLLSNCTYQPDIGSLSRVVLSMSGW